jgi:hypothetical protein
MTEAEMSTDEELRSRIDAAVKALISAIECAVVVERSETVTPLQGELLKGLLAAKEARQMAEGVRHEH